MRYLSGEEAKTAEKYFKQAAKIAIRSRCLRAKCGSIIVKDKQIIGTGFNSPPLNNIPSECVKEKLKPNFKSDRTCCIHAEQRAIIDALKNNPDKIKGSRIYFIRLNKKEKIERAGKPYCTICSKLALETGITEFALWHDKGICIYRTDEYNNLSFQYQE